MGAAPGGATLEVRLKPRSSRRGVGGLREGALELRVNAPPVDGRANDEAGKLLAEALGLSRAGIHLVAGARSRHKVFCLRGLTPEDLRERVDSLLKRS